MYKPIRWFSPHLNSGSKLRHWLTQEDCSILALEKRLLTLRRSAKYKI